MKQLIYTMPLNKPNHNGRIYSKESFDLDGVKAQIKSNTGFLGEFLEFGYVSDDNSIVNLDNECLVVTDFNVGDEYPEVEFEIVPTERGNMIKILLSSVDDFFDRYEILPRLYGDVDKDGNVKVDNFIAFDIVLKTVIYGQDNIKISKTI